MIAGCSSSGAADFSANVIESLITLSMHLKRPLMAICDLMPTDETISLMPR